MLRRRGLWVPATALGSVLAGLAAASGPALADCNQNGTPGSDDIICQSSDSSGIVDVNGLGANDKITVNSGSIVRVSGGDDDDEIYFNGGAITGGSATPPIVALGGGRGNDFMKLTGGQVGATGYSSTVSGEDGDDTIELDGATVYGIVRADTAVSGSNFTNVARLISGGILTPGDGSTTGFIGGFGNDTITVGSGDAATIMEIQGGVNGETGDDTITLLAGATMVWVDGRQGQDTITLDGATVQNFLVGGQQKDIINLLSGSVGGNVSGDLGGSDEGDDEITLNGATVVGSIEGNGGNDTIKLVSGNSGSVFGNAGLDIIDIGNADNPSASGPEIASVSGGDDTDTITLYNGVASSIGGDNGDDTISLLGGRVGKTSPGNVNGGAGNDQITLSGSAVGAVAGGDGDDLMSWSGGGLTSFNGGNGSDIMTVSAAAYDGSQTLNGGDDALTPDTFIDELTINAKTITTTGNKLLNWENLTLAGGGLTLSDGTLATGDPADATTGLFLTGGAYLKAGAALNLTGNMSIGAGSVYEQLSSGTHAVTGQLANAGTINLQNGAAADVLAVGNDYTGGGQFLVDINGDAADRMTVGGDVLGGPTQIVTNILGENSTGVPIEVVHVDGATKNGDFTAAGFELGAYSYSLQLAGNSWQFAPAEMSEGGTLYPTVGKLLAQFGKQTIATHFERTGSWARARATGETVANADGVTTLAGGDQTSNGNVWMRAIGQWADGEGTLKGGPASLGKQSLSYDADSVGVQGGVDAVIAETGTYLVTAGVFGQTGRLSGSAKNDSTRRSSGSTEADAWGIGGSIGLDTETFYVEAVGAWNSYDISTQSSSGSGDTDGNGYFVSLEAGREFAVSKAIKLVPQAQFAWVSTEIDTFTDGGGAVVSFEDQTTPIGRLGLAVDAAAGTYNDMPLRLTGILNYWQDFGDAAQTSVGGTLLEIDQSGGIIEAGAGFHWGNEQTPMHLHGELTYSDTVSGDGEQSWNGTVGMRIAF